MRSETLYVCSTTLAKLRPLELCASCAADMTRSTSPFRRACWAAKTEADVAGSAARKLVRESTARCDDGYARTITSCPPPTE